uniref:Uncharacterized protein n=1 Tax=Anguilla anguilla TaxID=7936 RepID=A0A0E9QRC7_ANGAN
MPFEHPCMFPLIFMFRDAVSAKMELVTLSFLLMACCLTLPTVNVR